MSKLKKGYYKNGEYIPGEGEVVVDVVGVFAPPEPPRLVVADLEEKSNVDLVDILREVVEVPFFVVKKLQGLQKWKFRLEKHIRHFGGVQWKILVGGKALVYRLKPKRYWFLRKIRGWRRLTGDSKGVLRFYQTMQQASQFRFGFLKRFSRLYRFMEGTGLITLLTRLWYQQGGVLGSFSRYEISRMQIRAFSFTGLLALYLQQGIINQVFRGFRVGGLWPAETSFFTNSVLKIKGGVALGSRAISLSSLKRGNRCWRVKPRLRKWPLWKQPISVKVLKIGIWRLRRRYVSARWRHKAWFKFSWFKWVRTQSRQRWVQKKPLLRHFKLANVFFKDLFFLTFAEHVGIMSRLRVAVKKPIVKTLEVFKKRKRSRKSRRFWRKLIGSWAQQRKEVVIRRLKRERRKLKRRQFPKLVVVKSRGGLFLYPTKQLRFYKKKFGVLSLRRQHWLRKWVQCSGVRGLVVKKRLLLQLVNNRVKSPRFFTKKGRFSVLKRRFFKKPVFLQATGHFFLDGVKLGAQKGPHKRQIAPRWPRGFDKARFNFKTVDCAVEYSKFLQYFLYNKYLLFLKTGVVASVLPEGLVNLSENQSNTAVFSNYLQLLHVHFFERVVSYYDRTSPLFYGAELMSKFIYISGQLLPWYLKYKARHYAWFLINHNKRRFVRKKKYVYKLKILFDRLLLWLYRVEDIRYLWGFLAQRVRMAAASVGGSSFFYKKTLKIRMVSN